MAHVINFNNVDRVYVSGDMTTIHFNGSEDIPFFGEEARQIRTILEALAKRRSGWFYINEED